MSVFIILIERLTCCPLVLHVHNWLYGMAERNMRKPFRLVRAWSVPAPVVKRSAHTEMGVSGT